MTSSDIFSLVSVSEVLPQLGGWVRVERQRLGWTQTELARRSGVPSATISRLELTGLGSTETLLKLLFALDRLSGVADYIKERSRLAALPVSLSEPMRTKPVLRVRMRKQVKS